MEKLLSPITKIISSSGQVLIEVLVALGVIVVIVSAVTISTATALSNAEFSKNQNQATQYAQEGMETLRELRDRDVTTFITFDGAYCLPENSSTLSQSSNCDVNIGSMFKRSVSIESNNLEACDGGSKASINVSWTDGKCPTGAYCHTATVVSCLAVSNMTSGL